jgi:hypothetical protein
MMVNYITHMNGVEKVTYQQARISDVLVAQTTYKK